MRSTIINIPLGGEEAPRKKDSLKTTVRFNMTLTIHYSVEDDARIWGDIGAQG
jgi:hypothetical protein